MGLGDSFVLNEFMFCTDHGREYCPSCFCDYRTGNNYQIELDEEVVWRFEDLFMTMDDRPALNAFALGAKIANKKEETYKCAKHGTVDCTTCFDWKKRVVQLMEVVERLRGEPEKAKPSPPTIATTAAAKKGKGKVVDVNDVD
ncbi:hypothetical protein D9756_009966 [Leucocoprinus leucothites]|uniref:Uncharacterized protein n=1 Tax=Leucocoprinus leucothites TaxID=201217 RepID=A0A8H5FS98_9AGAR|nr:hypothetical protein D9756_009966 [Leucoagaricus leucothites]